jgi:outer membrane lipoprotein-sorting protein
MPVLRLLLIFLLSAVTAQVADAARIAGKTASLNEVIDVVEAPFRLDRNGNPLLENVRADFFQRSTLVEKQKEIRADGQMYFKPATGSEPLKFRFDYYRPTSQEIICDGRTLWIYLRENRQVILSDVGEFFDPLHYNPARDRAINFLQGLGRISKDFTITFGPQMQDIAGNYILELRPKRASATVERLFITVSRDAVMLRIGGNPVVSSRQPLAEPDLRLFAILSTTVTDHEGNSTTIEFSNVQINSLVSDLTFEFNPPPDVQIVRPPSGR